MATVHLPNFFIIGAAKGGTTSLYRYVDEHPDVYMSPMKDTNFLCADAQWSRWFNYVTPNLDEYSALFAGATSEKAVGESSISYLPHPPAAGRIKSLVPDARLIAILRQPAERAYSDFVWLRARGLRHPRTFREVVTAEIEGAPDAMHFVRSGFYSEHLGRYLQFFDRSQLRVYLFDDLVSDAHSLVRDVYEFLEVDPTFVPTLQKYNATRYPPRNESVARALEGESRFKTAAKAVLPASARARMRAAVECRNREVPVFEPDVRARLQELYLDDILQLQDLIGRDLSEWLR